MSIIRDSIHVLHVDDEPDFADVAAEFLSRHDDRFDVDTATSASDAADRMAETGYDCIVSDFEMPGQDGIEFLQAVREDYPDLPFILYTGKGGEEVASEAISNGVTDYLQKESGTSQYEVLANRIINAVSQFHTRGELDRSQDLLQHTERLADTGGWEADVKTGEQRWTEGTYEIHGVDPASDFDPTVDAGVAFYHPDDQAEIDGLVERCIETGEPFEAELRLITADDRLCWVRSTGEPVRKDGDIVTIRGAIRDVTERKERERRLSEEKENYATLVEQSHDGILVLQGTEIVFANEQAANMLGYEDSELLDKPFLEIVAPDDRARLQDRYTRRLDPETESPPAQYDVRTLRKDGEQGHANISAAKIQFDGEPADLVTFRDITEQKQSEAELERAQTRFQTIFEEAPEAIVIYDREGRILDVNDRFQAELGYSRDVLSSMTVADIERGLTPDEVHDLLAEMHVGETRKLESVLERKDGSTFPVEIWTNKVEMDGDVRFLAFSRNITERQERDHELSKVRRRYEALIEAAPDPVFVADADTGTAIETNTAAETLLGVPREEIVGQNIGVVTPPEDFELYLEVFEEAKRANTTISRLSDGSRPELLTDDGETVPVEISAGPASVFDDEYVVGIFRDISDRVSKEQALEARNERLESFASIVSHDLRNPLNVASSRLALAKEEPDSEHVEKVEDAHERMEVLISDLLLLAQQGDPVGEYDAVEVSELCQDCWAGVNTNGHSSHVDIDRTIRADASRVKQIFENLFRNAVEHGGDAVTVTVGELDDGFYVADDGPGIPDAALGEVFQVGNSTKDEGTGFGLAIVKEIVEAHDWAINATEGTDGGARFEITGVELAA